MIGLIVNKACDLFDRPVRREFPEIHDKATPLDRVLLLMFAGTAAFLFWTVSCVLQVPFLLGLLAEYLFSPSGFWVFVQHWTITALVVLFYCFLVRQGLSKENKPCKP